MAWDGVTPGAWQREIHGCEASAARLAAGQHGDDLRPPLRCAERRTVGPIGWERVQHGGSAGDGRQFMSWIHYEDFVDAIRWLIDRDEMDGVINVASPNPLPNAEFMRVLREASGMSVGLPARKWMLEIGAVFMRTEPS